ncbi:MAG: PspC domain-containing protein [Bacteroidales bacterium]|jgi:phage shock protein PspC (stress-responsive transcriptional regulator)|nr:PspC domain-containing protein [Bacteroidales bacterium]
MDKTININLGGTLFQIDEEAYKILRDYLQAIDRKFKNTPGGSETIEDIESRIAEIFQSQKGTAGIISLENVVDMIRIIGKPEDFDQADAEDGSGRAVYTQPGPRKKMFRNPENQIIGGVCGGIGAYTNTNPVWIRILFVLITCFFFAGVFIYVALWIALPSAESDSRKKEMYGGMNNLARPGYTVNTPSNKIGNAFDVIFRALGKVFFIIIRIILIAFGTMLVLCGFLALLSFVMIFVFKYPGSFSTDAFGFNMAYLPDFLNYIISPAVVPWVKALIAMAVVIPFMVLIYGGIRLIFWFRARDGFVWLAGFVLWVMSAAALSIILINEGVGFAENEQTVSQEYFRTAPDTLYIMTGRTIADMNTDKEIEIPDEDYNIFISEEKKEIYIRTSLDINSDERKSASVTIRKHSAGRSKFSAIENAERLQYNFRIAGDTLYLDEFFTIPSGSKWSFDYVGVTVSVPENTVIHMDRTAESLFHSTDDDDFVSDPQKSFWLMTEEGLDYIGHQNR